MYLFYIDESGHREYSSDLGYFALCATDVPAPQWKAINADVFRLKKAFFHDAQVEVKSSWLRNPRERQKRYLSCYQISEQELHAFTEQLYCCLLSYDVVLIAAVVDKEQMKRKYSKPQSPSSLAYRYTIERIEHFLLGKPQTYGILVFDKITDLELGRKGYENLLARQHLRYLEEGTDYMAISRVVEGLLFIPSHENNLLQLADLCAYNIYRQFTDFGGEWDARGAFTSRYAYFQRIEPKLDSRPDGNYTGWGIKKFP